MISSLVTFARRKPKLIVSIWVAAALVCIPFAIGLQSHLEAGGFTNPRGQATQAQKLGEQAFGEAPNNLLVILKSKSPVEKWIAPVGDILSKLPHAFEVQNYSEHPTWLAENGRTTLLEVGLGMGDTAAQNLVPLANAKINAKLANKHVQAIVTGAPALNYALSVASQQDAERAELLAFPILLLVLLVVFRSLMATAIPLVLAVFSIDLASMVGFFIDKLTPLTILYSNAISMIGLAVGIDYSLFIIKRFRDELSTDPSVEKAIKRSMETAGRSVFFSGLTVIAALAALLIPRVTVFTTIGLGGMIVTAIAILASMTLLPAVLQILGSRINSGRVPWKLKFASNRQSDGGYRYPAIVSLTVLAGLLATVIPLFGLHLQVPVASANILPAGNSARQGLDMVEQDSMARDLFPVQVILVSSTQDGGVLLRAVGRVSQLAKADKEVASVTSVSGIVSSMKLPGKKEGTTSETNVNQSFSKSEAEFPKSLWSTLGGKLAAQVIITTKDGPDSVAVHNLVRQLRDELPPLVGTEVSVLVGGQTAQGIDFDNLVTSALPVVIGFVLALSAILLLVAFRSILLALLALAFNGLVSASSLGLLTLIEKHLNQQINSVTPLLVLAVMFGLSMDYMVIMATRMRELFQQGSTHREAVVTGTRKTAGMVNGAALIMVGVFAAFGTAQVSVVQQLGIGLALAVALDAVVVRRVLMPNIFLLMGECIWGRQHKKISAAEKNSGRLSTLDWQTEIQISQLSGK